MVDSNPVLQEKLNKAWKFFLAAALLTVSVTSAPGQAIRIAS